MTPTSTRPPRAGLPRLFALPAPTLVLRDMSLCIAVDQMRNHVEPFAVDHLFTGIVEVKLDEGIAMAAYR